jgi:hypothetical protein
MRGVFGLVAIALVACLFLAEPAEAARRSSFRSVERSRGSSFNSRSFHSQSFRGQSFRGAQFDQFGRVLVPVQPHGFGPTVFVPLGFFH